MWRGRDLRGVVRTAADPVLPLRLCASLDRSPAALRGLSGCRPDPAAVEAPPLRGAQREGGPRSRSWVGRVEQIENRQAEPDGRK